MANNDQSTEIKSFREGSEPHSLLKAVPHCCWVWEASSLIAPGELASAMCFVSFLNLVCHCLCWKCWCILLFPVLALLSQVGSSVWDGAACETPAARLPLFCLTPGGDAASTA